MRTDSGRPDELRPVTALFADVVGSTKLGEALSPDEVKSIIGECVSRMTQAVEGYGGVVGAFMGDGIAAFFGLGAAREDDCVRAALAGLEILSAMSQYASEIEKAWGIVGFAVRVGINAGRVATGWIGGEQPQLVALGDPINVAARLQALAAPGTIVVGASVADRLEGRFELEELGTVAVRGRSKRVEAWRIVRDRGEAGVIADGHECIGRELELQTLAEVAEEALRGRGAIVLVTGDAGIGKTFVVNQFRRRSSECVAWLYGGCSSQKVNRPYGPFIDALREWLNVQPDDPKIVVRVRLLARLRALLGASTDRVASTLSYLLGIDLSDDVQRSLELSSAEGVAPQVRAAYVKWLSALAKDRPVVLAIDDCERADSASLWLIEELFELSEGLPVVLAIVLRNEPESPGWRTRLRALAEYSHRSRDVRLKPLNDVEADQLVARVDSEGVLSPAGRCDVRLRAEGNPLYLEELTRAAMVRVGHGRDLPAAEGSALPAPLEGILLSRIDRLPVESRELLQVAAVYGRRVPRGALDRVVGTDKVERALRAALRDGILHEDGRWPVQEYAFKHVLVRDAILSTLTPEVERRLHGAIAVALEQGAVPTESLETIASHYVAGGNGTKAIEYLERAGLRAAALGSPGDALELLDQARTMTLGQPANEAASAATYRRLSGSCAELLRVMGDYAGARARWDELLMTATDSRERVGVLYELARTEFELGNCEAAYAKCLEIADREELDPEMKVRFLLLMAGIAFRQDDLETVRELLSEANGVRGYVSASVETLMASSWAGFYAATGKLDEAEKCATAATASAESAADYALYLRVQRDLGIVRFVNGQLPESQNLLEAVFERAFDTGHTTRAQEALATLVGVYLLRGALAKGRAGGLEALEWIRAPFWRAAVLSNLGAIERECGLRDEATTHLLSALEIGQHNRESAVLAGLSSVRLARLALDEGNVEEGVRYARSVVRSHADCGRVDVQLQARVLLAEGALMGGGIDLAERHLQAAFEFAERTDKTELPQLWRVRGLVCRAGGSGESSTWFERGLKDSRKMGMRLEEARAHMALGSLEDDPHSPHFTRAREIFLECECERGLTELRRALMGAGVP